jgi:hypothetical protein
VNDYFAFQAAYYMTKPSVLQRHLSDTLKLNEDKCDAFVNAWISSAKGIVEHLRKRSLFPAQVGKTFLHCSCKLMEQSSSSLKRQDFIGIGYLLRSLAGRTQLN